MAMCGGTSAARDPSSEESEFIVQIREEFESRTGDKTETFEVVQVKSQVVAGTNYFAKVKIGSDKYAHVRVFKPLPCNGTKGELHSYQLDKKHEDAIDYF